MFQVEIQVAFLQAINETSFKLLQWFFGLKMELICANIIGKCNSEMKFTRVLNFTGHLPNP